MCERMKLNMDNFNGQNQMENNTNMQGQYMQNPYPQYQQMPQNMYQQMPENMYQQAPQNMYQQAPQNMQESQMYMQQPQQYMQNIQQPQQYAQNVNFEQTEKPNSKKKRKWLKWSLIIGIPVVLLVATIFIIKMIVGPSYDIDDFDNVKKACRKVFDLEFEDMEIKEDEYYYAVYAPMGMVKKMEGWGTRTSEYSKVNVVWYEFENEDDAREYYENNVERAKEGYNLEKEYLEESGEELDMEISFDSNETITEKCRIDSDYAVKNVLITKGNCGLELNISGDDIEPINKLMKKFYNKLD